MVVDMIHFDTLEYVKILENAGVLPQQAEAFAKAQQVSLTQNGSILARKSDIDDLQKEMDLKFKDVDLKFKDVDIKLRDLRLDLQSEIHGLAVKVNQHSWMLGVLLASTGTIMAGIFSIMWKIFGW